MKYCRHCGTELDDNVKFCSKCGKTPDEEPIAQNASNTQTTSAPDIVKTLSSRLQLNGVFWIVSACLQLVFIVSNVICAVIYILGIYTIPLALIYLAVAVLQIAVCVFNIIFAVKSFKNSKRILTDPTGIVATYEPLALPIVGIVVNVLLGYLVCGVAPVIQLAYVRQYVVDHKDEFLALEN